MRKLIVLLNHIAEKSKNFFACALKRLLIELWNSLRFTKPTTSIRAANALPVESVTRFQRQAMPRSHGDLSR